MIDSFEWFRKYDRPKEQCKFVGIDLLFTDDVAEFKWN
jgi:hypothetical protein